MRLTRRQRVLDALACLTLSTLCFSQARLETLFRTDWDFYRRVPLGAVALLALVLDITALATVFFLGVRVVRRARRPASRRVAALAGAATLLIAINYARINHETVGRWAEVIGRPGLLAVVVLVLTASLAWPRPALRVMRGLALILSPLAVITAAHVAGLLLELAATPPSRTVDPAPRERAAPSLRRVVWLVLDDLDQRVAFEDRPAGLALPELDRLRRESLYADAARPPAGVTNISMPALVTGRPVVAVAPTSPRDLELTFADGTVARWSAHPNVFSRARSLGYDTALIGWRLPYPRVLGASLGLADWRPSVEHEQVRDDTFGGSLLSQWGSLAPPLNLRRLSRRRFAELADPAIRAAADRRFGLVLLHLPLPQAPGIYDPSTGRLTAWNFTGAGGGYVDNLALADRVVADVRHGIERARLGDSTWIVVSAAHWWRESKPYDGREDHRVPFLVRPPDGGRATHVDNAFSTLVTQDLLLAILRGGLNDTGDVAAWLARHAVAPPEDYTSEGRPIP